MALEFICSNKIEFNEKVNIPRCSNKYELDCSNGEISFYHDNPGIRIKLSSWRIPKGARQMDFEKITSKFEDSFFIPRFYDGNGKLLKIGNR